MKRFWENLLEWKSAAALIFTGSVILHSIVMLILGIKTITIEGIICLLVLSCIGGLLQLLLFSESIKKRLRYSMCGIIFAVTALGLLSVTVVICVGLQLFSMHLEYWLIISGIFLIVFVFMAIGFEVYHRQMGKKYNGLLGQYRKQHNLNQREEA